MIEPPHVVTSTPVHAAVIPLVILRADMPKHFGPAIAEIMAELPRQEIAPARPVFAHHLRMPPGQFDFEVGVPVAGPVVEARRVESRDFPPRTVARTIYRGDYSGLHGARGAFNDWLAEQGHAYAPDLFEKYLTDPGATPDSRPGELAHPARPAARLIRP